MYFVVFYGSTADFAWVTDAATIPYHGVEAFTKYAQEMVDKVGLERVMKTRRSIGLGSDEVSERTIDRTISIESDHWSTRRLGDSRARSRHGNETEQ